MKAAGTYQAYLHTEIMRVVPTYLAFGVGGVAVRVYPVADEVSCRCTSEHEGEAGDHGSFRQLFQYPQLWFAVIANFCNVGAQICELEQSDSVYEAVHGGDERTAAYYLTGVRWLRWWWGGLFRRR